MRFFDNGWDEILSEELKKDYFQKLIEKVHDEYNSYRVYPPQSKVFSAFKLTDYGDTKVVIIGQDPYHQQGQAHGVSFSVLPGVQIPPSLKNIFKEIVNDVGGFVPDNGCLVPWARQGVLLLNAVLTVRDSSPNSHQKLGWERFTDRVIELLSQRSEPIIFLLWGNNAKKKLEFIDTKKHIVLQAAHPSPLSAHNGFFGCNHFSKTNQLLKSMGKQPINWQIDNINQKFV